MNCLYCYQSLADGELDFHAACSRKMFGQPVPPILEYSEAQMQELALKVVRSQIAVTGVQPKISLDIAEARAGQGPARFTIVGLWGGYILKPPFDRFPGLPEVEDLTMHLAAIADIATVPHSLIRLQSGSLAYITRRIDRIRPKRKAEQGAKLHMEDMCQITGKLSEDKYQGSYEQIAKALLAYSANPVLDVINFFEQVVFCFLTGNADGHLKNFSLIDLPQIGNTLTPGYDMVATALITPDDPEELALTLNGRKRKLQQKDFEAAFNTLKLDAAVQRNIFSKFSRVLATWMAFIDRSFLADDGKANYKALIVQRAAQLGIQPTATHS
jgi:serine/threonine-protein kinase HipA